jgi:hypothetical protein
MNPTWLGRFKPMSARNGVKNDITPLIFQGT